MELGKSSNNDLNVETTGRGQSVTTLARQGVASCTTSLRVMDMIGLAYVMFAVSVVMVAVRITNLDISSMLTMSLGLQCLAFALLLALVEKQGQFAGISVKMVLMYSAVSACRLCSTLFKQGYLPDDKTGDFVYQMCDVVSLCISFGILLQAAGRHASTVDVEADSFSLWPVVALCVLSAIFIHGDLDASPFFDIMWMISLNLDAAAMVPQLWMLAKRGGVVTPLMGHFIACMVLSRLLSFGFWLMAFPELGPIGGGANVAGVFIVLPQLAQVLIAADFMYLYVRSHLNNEDLVKGILTVPTATPMVDMAADAMGREV